MPAPKSTDFGTGRQGRDTTVVYGVNHHVLRGDMTVVSNALPYHQLPGTGCQGAAHEQPGIVKGLMTTIHAYTNDQVLTDVRHRICVRARSATQSMIPTETGAAAAGWSGTYRTERQTGWFRGARTDHQRIDGRPVGDGGTQYQQDEVNALMRAANEGPLKGVLATTICRWFRRLQPHNEASIFDSTLTKVMWTAMVKVSPWYDNGGELLLQMLKHHQGNDGSQK